MNNNKISIVLPVYNGAKYVGRSINSVLNQTYHNLELIIVNDCSTDNTLNVISEYAKKDSRIKILNNTSNQKLPRTLNNGFKAATGEYLTWTSDDNQYHPTALQRMAQILDDMSDIELVYADFSIVDMEGNLINEIKEEEPSAIRYRDNIGACFLYRHSLADKVGDYNPNAFLAEDYDFFIRCYEQAHGKFYHLSEDLYDYGRHDNNLSATRQNEIAHKAFDVMMTHLDFLLSECHTVAERNRLYYELLALLKDEDEKKAQCLKFYSMDKAFAKEDKSHARNRKIHAIRMSMHNIVSKLKALVAAP